jgi:hypothetical protein
VDDRGDRFPIQAHRAQWRGTTRRRGTGRTISNPFEFSHDAASKSRASAAMVNVT